MKYKITQSEHSKILNELETIRTINNNLTTQINSLYGLIQNIEVDSE